MPVAEVEIESIAAGGDGVGRAAGLVVFVPRSAPGDVAEVELVSRGSFARGAIRSLRVRSPHRVDPPCAHYVRDRCGGCQLQHIDYGAQLAAKARIVHDALARIGGRDLARPEVRPSEARWRYRRKLTLGMRRRRDGWIAGLHPYDEPARIFALADCPITDERVIAVWREILSAAAHLPRERALRGAVRVDDGGASFVLEGGSAWQERRVFFARVPSLDALWWTSEKGTRRLIERRGDEPRTGASFVQVNRAVALEMRAWVRDRVLAHAPRTVVDAYAGTGETAIAIAESGAQVTAIEVDREASAWCARRLPAGSRAVAARVEDAFGDALPTDVVILNPPRAGVDARVCAALDRSPAPARAVLYVSCNPATLARDLARLPRWRVASLRAFDMFPQTAHVETVCELVPEGA